MINQWLSTSIDQIQELHVLTNTIKVAHMNFIKTFFYNTSIFIKKQQSNTKTTVIKCQTFNQIFLSYLSKT